MTHPILLNVSIRTALAAIVCGVAMFGPLRPAAAHFLWLKTLADDGQPRAFLFFGESPDDEAYHLPERLAAAKISRQAADGSRAALDSEPLQNDDRVGLVARLPNDQPCALETHAQYGVYADSLLTYYAKHVHAAKNDQLGSVGPSKELAFDIVPRADGQQLQLTVYWQGEPVPDAGLTITFADGETAEEVSDENGRVTVKPTAAGLVSVMANYHDDAAEGELDGSRYKLAAHYVTLTFPWHGESASATKPQTDGKTSSLPTLPEGLASFGAVVCDGWLYVYGGHIGTEHEHSAENLNPHFRRLRLDGGSQWESLPMQTPLQGLPLVAHGGKVYRVGGLDAHNATPDDEEDLHSTDDFACYDPATGEWTALEPLPAARSSHNATVIGDRLYVVGGWKLAGPGQTEWQRTALVYDFGDPGAGWRELPRQPFVRRALAAGHWNGKLVAIGGIDDDRDISRRADIFDPETGQWTAGPELPGQGMAGFGLSAWNLDGNLYVSGLPGVLYRLSDDGAEWEEATQLATPRFFHQLVPNGTDSLLAVGGASHEGHIADIERIELR